MKKNYLFSLLLSLSSFCAFSQPGALNRSFADTGIFVTDGVLTGTSVHLNTVAVQADGKIIAAGESGFAPTILRLLPDGKVDSTYGVNGVVTIPFAVVNDFLPDGEIYTSGIQADGKTVVAGYKSLGSGYSYLLLARLKTDGSLDSSFGKSGVVTVDSIHGAQLSPIRALQIQPDGKIVVAGDATYIEGEGYLLARFTATGEPDSSFGVNGYYIPHVYAGSDALNALALQADDKIVAAGYNFTVLRFNTNGTPDSTFGTNGSTAYLTAEGLARTVAIQPDGKIVAAGNSSDQYFLARYNTDGSFDASFGADHNGIVIGQFDNVEMGITSMLLLPDNKILLGGLAADDNAQFTDMALLRYRANGLIDSGFGNQGLVMVGAEYEFSFIYGMAFSGNNVVAAGKSYTSNGYGNSGVVAEFNSAYITAVPQVQTNNSLLFYPNPVQQTALLKYTQPTSGPVSIRLTDVQGRLVETYLNNEKQPAGEQQQVIDIPYSLAAGIYLLTVCTESGTATLKVMKEKE